MKSRILSVLVLLLLLAGIIGAQDAPPTPPNQQSVLANCLVSKENEQYFRLLSEYQQRQIDALTKENAALKAAK